MASGFDYGHRAPARGVRRVVPAVPAVALVQDCPAGISWQAPQRSTQCSRSSVSAQSLGPSATWTALHL